MDLVIHFAQKFRIPLIFACLSLLLFIASFFFVLKNDKSSEIIFTTNESSSSAILTNSIAVNIEGEVESPGVYMMDSKSRVNDLIEKAGGLTASADAGWISKYINKAQILNDGDKLYIPSLEDNKVNQTTSNSIQTSLTGGSMKININLASQSELEALPGIGEKTAVKIIEGRPYQELNDLRSKKIVGESVYEKIKDLISLL